MDKRLIFLVIPAIIVLAAAFAWPYATIQEKTLRAQLSYPWIDETRSGSRLIQPIPVHLDLDSETVALGEKLFYDPRLSGEGTISCASCHPVSGAGADGLPTSVMVDGGNDEMNTPTVFNVAFNYHLLWIGRFNTLEEQVDGVINSPKHMASNWPEIIQRLSSDETYVQAFHSVYDEDINSQNIMNAIATYERSMTTPNSAFDQYLLGDAAAITEDQLAGYQLFKSYGCVSCHQGINVGGNILAPLGVFKDYFADKKSLSSTDLGHYSLTGQERDRHVFRVPSLRNVARTAPYFHDGSIPTLYGAVSAMGEYQLGRNLPPEDIALIVGFLESLTGEYKGERL